MIQAIVCPSVFMSGEVEKEEGLVAAVELVDVRAVDGDVEGAVARAVDVGDAARILTSLGSVGVGLDFELLDGVAEGEVVVAVVEVAEYQVELNYCLVYFVVL